MTKAEIRKIMKLQRNNIPEEDRRKMDTNIRRSLLRLEEYQKCQTLFCYISFGTELDTRQIIDQALYEKKAVYVPRVEDNHGMEFYRIHHLDGLQISRFGVPEPCGEAELRYRPLVDDNNTSIPLMLLPGLAFDLHGNRIGYGAGYYDRYLDQFPPEYFYKVALCYDFQLMEQIESQEYDIGADAIITEMKYLRCRS